MSVQELKQAIRAGHDVMHHGEFHGSVMRKRDAELLELYLKCHPAVLKRMNCWSGVIYPRSSALVRRLLAHGLDPNRPNWLGKTYLHACAENGDRSIAAVFLEAGADINARGLEFNETPLAVAVRSTGRWKEKDQPHQAQRGRRMVEFLLIRGAATNLPGDEAWATPLAWARKLKVPEIEELLMKYGAT
jgi:ankyrin repeat protein